MNHLSRIRVSAVVGLFLFCFVTASAQLEKKPYTEWTEKEAQKLLNESPWGQTQTISDLSNMFATLRDKAQLTTGISDVTRVNLRIRFLSAKPVRQAFSRFMELQQKGKVSEQLASQLKAFAGADFPDYVIVTVSCDAPNPSSLFQAVNSILYQTITAELKNNTYLLVKGGQRVFLQEYQPPRKDGLGARFVFPRLPDGKPFITPDGGDVLFRSEAMGLTMRYKTKDMTWDGKLEY